MDLQPNGLPKFTVVFAGIVQGVPQFAAISPVTNKMHIIARHRVGPGKRTGLNEKYSAYTGADLRAIRAVNGVGRPPKSKRPV